MNQDDVKHHFVAFVKNAKGQLVELDGTKQGPHVVADACEDLLRDSIKELQKRIEDKDISESLAVLTLSKNPDA